MGRGPDAKEIGRFSKVGVAHAILGDEHVRDAYERIS